MPGRQEFEKKSASQAVCVLVGADQDRGIECNSHRRGRQVRRHTAEGLLNGLFVLFLRYVFELLVDLFEMTFKTGWHRLSHRIVGSFMSCVGTDAN